MKKVHRTRKYESKSKRRLAKNTTKHVLKRGCQDGLAKAEEDSKKKFSFVDGFKGVWRSPSQKAQDEAQKLLAKAVFKLLILYI